MKYVTFAYMKALIIALSLVFIAQLGFCQTLILSQNELLKEIKKADQFQLEQVKEFADPEKSPLPKDSSIHFTGPEYFKTNTLYILKAKFEVIENGKEFEMKTSTDRLPLYKDYALLTFFLRGQEFQLHAYQNVKYSKIEGHENELFIPFNDYTNGIDSYGGGRYLDIQIPEEDVMILNFNMTYNPYCAYNNKYSCPIPPEENKLAIGIEAGVKKYH